MKRAIVCGCIAGIAAVLGCSRTPAAPQDYVTVDDFESYTDKSPKRVFQAWIDGWGFSPDDFFAKGDPGNGSGAMVGHDPAIGHIMERKIRHSGRQSMPVEYNNASNPYYSEASRTWKTPQDWTRDGVTTLVLYFHGDVNNTSAPLYVKINGAKVVYNDGAACTAAPAWTQWNIDLAQFGESLKAVETLTIGIGDGSAGAAGTIFIDDIRLYRTPSPATPSTNSAPATTPWTSPWC